MMMDGDGRVDWNVCFSIYCWLLWKSRCSKVLDVDHVERESILERGNRLVDDCGIAFGVQQQRLPTETSYTQQWGGSRRGWIMGNVDAAVNPSDGSVAVGGVFRDDSGEKNEVADKLACLGKQQSLKGVMFVVPPDVVIDLVDDEQRSWGMRLLVAASTSSHCRGVDPGG
ncbi:hypothetical protein V6N13_038155 [Hibiscus sabdariffa]